MHELIALAILNARPPASSTHRIKASREQDVSDPNRKLLTGLLIVSKAITMSSLSLWVSFVQGRRSRVSSPGTGTDGLPQPVRRWRDGYDDIGPDIGLQSARPWSLGSARPTDVPQCVTSTGREVHCNRTITGG